MSNELIAIETLKPQELFTLPDAEGIDPLIEALEKSARSILLDPETASGRAEIKSLAYKVARTKTAIDNLGKEVTEEWKRQSKAVDAKRAKIRDRLEKLQEDIRRPVTEFEEKEAKRVEAHEAALHQVEAAASVDGWQVIPVDALKARRDRVNEAAKRDWQEYRERADEVIGKALGKIDGAIRQREAYDAEQLELKRLREEKAEREKQDEADRIRKEAEAEAERKAEQKRQREAEEREQAEARRVQQHKAGMASMEQCLNVPAVASYAAAEQRIATLNGIFGAGSRDWQEFFSEAKAVHSKVLTLLEKQRDELKAAEDKAAEEARIAAEEKRKRDEADAAERAAAAERLRIENEQKQQAAEEEKRRKDEAHRAAICRDVRLALDKLIAGEKGSAEMLATRIIDAIADGQIPHISIKF